MTMVDRCGALAGAAGFLLTTIGGDVLGTPPGSQVVHPSGQQSLDNLHWMADSTSAQVGMSLELLGFAFSIVFVAYLCHRVRGAGWLAVAALVGGIVWIAVKLASGAPMFAAYGLRDEISASTAQMLVDINGASFVISWIPKGIFVAFAAAAGMVSGTIGRVLGWGGVIAGVTTVGITAAAGADVLSANFLPFLLCVLWGLLVSLRLGLARTAPDLAEDTPDWTPAGV